MSLFFDPWSLGIPPGNTTTTSQFQQNESLKLVLKKEQILRNKGMQFQQPTSGDRMTRVPLHPLSRRQFLTMEIEGKRCDRGTRRGV